MNIFEDLKLSEQLLKSIKHLGLTKPTKIQELSIPHILAGRDVIGQSATGSGKTLAFGCGIIEQVVPGQGLQALILTPTRELAEQVKDALRTFAYQKPMRIITVYGGVSINPQIDDLRRADVVVGTPGRLLDHLQRGTINVSKVKLLVLDEADRMLDMGFITDVERIISVCPKKRQTLFFSATISTEIRALSNRYMNNPQQVEATKLVDPSKLKQEYYNVPRNKKMALLVHLVQNEKSGLIMVFCNTRRTTDFVVKNLKANRIDAIAIHGGLTQNKRTKTITLFNKARVNVLVCTDVAARGLHIENVSHVYNYEIPKDPKDYVHRIGRTARAGEYGKVINLLCDYDFENFSRILEDYRSFTITKMNVPSLKRVVIKSDQGRQQGRSQGRQQQHGRRQQGGFGGKSGGHNNRNRWNLEFA